MEYFRTNYPGPNTIIFDPNWHAPKIYRAAIAASAYRELVEALQLAFKLPRPWMDGGVTFAEWDAAISKIESVLAKARDE